jgi:hypothetical protein
MSVNSICISVNGRNFHQEISAGIRERPFQLLRLKEVTAGFPSPATPFPQLPPKKGLVFFPRDYPIAHPCLPRGVSGWSLAYGVAHNVQNIFRLLHPFSSSLSRSREKNR